MPGLQMGEYSRGGTLYLKFGPLKRFANAFTVYYSAHDNPREGLDKSKYKVFVRATGDNLE